MIRDELLEEIRKLPVIDAHSHMKRDQLAAEKLEKVALYHMVGYVLRAAGGETPDEGDDESETPLLRLADAWSAVSRSAFGWMLRLIFRDLYDFDEPLTRESLPRLQKQFDERASRDDWAEQVLGRTNIRRMLSNRSDVAPLSPGDYDPGMRFTTETSVITSHREHQPLRKRIRKAAEGFDVEVRGIADVREIVQRFFERVSFEDRRAYVTWPSAQADFRPAPDGVLDDAVRTCMAGDYLSLGAERLIEGAIIREVCAAVRGRVPVFQFVYGTQSIAGASRGSNRPVARRCPELASSMGHLFAEFPDLHFNIMTGFESDEFTWCSQCLAYENVSLLGGWWQTFHFSVLHHLWQRRFDMAPTTKLMAFFSDGYCVDWVYARLRVVQQTLANVLAERIDRGFLTFDDAVAMAREALFETPRRIFLPDETIT